MAQEYDWYESIISFIRKLIVICCRISMPCDTLIVTTYDMEEIFIDDRCKRCLLILTNYLLNVFKMLKSYSLFTT